MRRIIWVLLLTVALGVMVWFQKSPKEIVVLPTPLPQARLLAVTDFELVEIARDLYVPWSLVFTSDSRMLVSERNGNIRQIVDKQLRLKPVLYFPEVASEGEGGLMGLAVHPDYGQNKYVYAMLSYWQNGDMWIKIERLIDKEEALLRDAVILDHIRGAFNHDGGRIRFGPDRKLYVSTGDAGDGELAQNPDVLEGKILRINDDGSIPADNPFPNSPVYSLGHRNSQGFDWHPTSGLLYATEHGPSGFDGPPGGDEINLIEPGGNYGWPRLSHDQAAAWAISPVIAFTPAIAPAGARFYSGEVFPMLSGHLLVAGLRGAGLFEIAFDEGQKSGVLFWRKIPGIEIGRIRDIAIDKSGLIYLLTSNRDGRGTVFDGDDKVYAIKRK